LAGHRFLLSALVSLYNSEKFIIGCIEDLTRQTLFRKGLMEIVIVDSGSEQDEARIVREAQERHANITYVRTERETLYAAWNRAIGLASGRYLSNANSDDRHRPDALEKLADILENRPDLDLVYGDCLVSEIPNETFEQNPGTRLFLYPDYFPPASLLHYQFGPQSVWRSSVHETIGLFDGSLKAAGDFDFNLKFARAGLKAFHLPETLGLYLEHAGAISSRDNVMAGENKILSERYRSKEAVLSIYGGVLPIDSARMGAACLADLGMRALAYYPPWWGGRAETDLPLAIECFSWALEEDSACVEALYGLAVAACLKGAPDSAHTFLAHARKHALVTGKIDRLQETVLAGGSITEDHLWYPLPFLPAQKALSRPAGGRAKEGAFHDPATTPGSDRLSVTFVASSGPIPPEGSCGGLESAVRASARAMAVRGHRVSIAGATGGSGRIDRDGVAYLPYDAWARGDYPEFSEECDILAFCSGPDLGSYRHVPPRTARVVLFHHQKIGFLTGTDARALLAQEADRVVCVSEAVRDNLREAGVPAAKLRTVHNGVDETVFFPREIPRDPGRILFVGALVPDKNPDLLIRAFLRLADRHPLATLRLCGGAALWGASEYLNREAILAACPRIEFTGILSPETLAEEYSRASICVIPSRFESFSLVSLEAQACGCVPLVADVGGAPETVIDGETGVVYRPNDEETLAHALDALLSAPAWVEKAGRAAARSMPERFSWKRTAEGYEGVFREAIMARADRASCATGEPAGIPRVSVVIPCYNYARFLRSAVESVVAQAYRSWEIVIVDDGSTDESRTVARELIAENPDRSIRLVEQPNSGHPARARNRGIGVARGEYILPLDADDRIAPDYLGKTVAVLDAHPEIGVAYTHIRHFGDRDDVYPSGAFDTNVLAGDNVLPYCALFRKRLWEKVGGYRSDVGYEDWHFWLDASLKGWKGQLVPEPLFLYRKHGGGRLLEDNDRRPRLLAQMVVLHPQLYGAETVSSARKILDGVGAPLPPEGADRAGLRLLIACDYFWPMVGGLEVIAEDLGAHLVGLGHSVDVATGALPNRTSDTLRGMRILSLPRTFDADKQRWTATEGLSRLIEEGGYDGCILLGDPTTWVLWGLEGTRVPKKTRIIIQPLINEEGYGTWRDNAEFRRRLADLLRRADAVVSLSRGGIPCRLFAEEGIRTVYLPNATTPESRMQDFRNRYDVPSDTFLMVHVGNLWPVKNQAGLLKTLRSMPGDWRLFLVGHPTPERAFVDEVLQAVASDPRVTLLPGLPRAEAASAMKAADLLLLPSKGEVSPVTLIEAMSHGTPWLATPECGAASEFAGGVIASLPLFPTVIEALAAQPGLCRELGAAGNGHWRACFSWGAVTAQWDLLVRTGKTGRDFAMPEGVSMAMDEIGRRLSSALSAGDASNESSLREEPLEKGNSFRVVAILSAHNEGDIIDPVIGYLVGQGVGVYLIDHVSTDDTVEKASKWLGRGLLHIEKFPGDAGFPEENRREYIWSHILRRKEQLAASLEADWFIHHDADEFRESPWEGLSLSEAIRYVDRLGCNAIDFELFNFRPTDDRFVPGTDVRDALRYYERAESFNTRQIKAWKKTAAPVRIVESGGHDIAFEGRKVFPVKFILRHYPVRSQQHGERKVFRERKGRFNAAERSAGWHVQYDGIEKGQSFLADPAVLRLYDPQATRLELLSTDALRAVRQMAAEDAAAGAARAASGKYPAREAALKSKRDGKPGDALVTLLGLMKAGDASVLPDIGDCLAALGRMDEARDVYEEGRRACPGESRCMTGLGVLALMAGDAARAGLLFSEAIAANRDDAAAVCGLGMVRVSEGRLGEAFDLFTRSLEIDPENSTALDQLVRASVESGDLGRAETALGRHLDMHPSDPNMLFTAAGILWKQGKGDRAIDLLDRLDFVSPGYDGAEELRGLVIAESVPEGR
jgi:glycosyltransferase involved in cell wall biosynthesis/tetratricopeptide (TPR) repeat protein